MPGKIPLIVRLGGVGAMGEGYLRRYDSGLLRGIYTQVLGLQVFQNSGISCTTGLLWHRALGIFQFR